MSFHKEHCYDLKDFNDLKGKVVTIKSIHGRPFNDARAVFLCLDEAPDGGYLHVISSSQRECGIRYDDILGVLKKEYIPDRFKKEVANISIKDAYERTNFYGYALDERGYDTPGTPLADIKDVEEYVSLQKEIQHEIRITDMDDCLLLHIVEGQLVFPHIETMEQSQHVTMAQAM